MFLVGGGLMTSLNSLSHTLSRIDTAKAIVEVDESLRLGGVFGLGRVRKSVVVEEW